MSKLEVLFFLLIVGCWVPNPNYKAPPDMKIAPDIDMAGCGRDFNGGGGGRNRPEVLLKGGTFFMQGKQVSIQDFYLDIYEVTVKAYRDCLGASFCTKPADTNSRCNWTEAVASKEDHPINCIDWNQAKAFCEWAKTNGRLPNEAEWEYAAGGVQNARYPWGSDTPKRSDSPARLCWSETTGGGTCPVGNFGKTLFGIQTCLGVFDLAGNVWEWTNSCGTGCKLRGGSWLSYPGVEVEFQSDYQLVEKPKTFQDIAVGVRCARN